jgi:hypothetical protein
MQEFVDHGEEVAQRADRLDGCGVGAEGPAGDGEEEGILDELERDVALVEGFGEKAILSQDAVESSGEVAVVVKDARDVERAVIHQETSGIAAWT